MVLYLLNEANASERKLRLYAVARCQRFADRQLDERLRHAVLVGEQYADGMATKDAVTEADAQLTQSLRDFSGTSEESNEHALVVATCRCCLELESRLEIAGYWVAFVVRSIPADADWLRDIFGNPFRPVVFDPAWRTEAAVGIAAKMYDDRDFRAMPILADALEEAGCDSPDILSHCRNPGVHVRGCWVVDLVLGKE
jgi:hypothetical protein